MQSDERPSFWRHLVESCVVVVLTVISDAVARALVAWWEAEREKKRKRRASRARSKKAHGKRA